MARECGELEESDTAHLECLALVRVCIDPTKRVGGGCRSYGLSRRARRRKMLTNLLLFAETSCQAFGPWVGRLDSYSELKMRYEIRLLAREQHQLLSARIQ